MGIFFSQKSREKSFGPLELLGRITEIGSDTFFGLAAGSSATGVIGARFGCFLIGQKRLNLTL